MKSGKPWAHANQGFIFIERKHVYFYVKESCLLRQFPEIFYINGFRSYSLWKLTYSFWEIMFFIKIYIIREKSSSSGRIYLFSINLIIFIFRKYFLSGKSSCFWKITCLQINWHLLKIKSLIPQYFQRSNLKYYFQWFRNFVKKFNF